MSNTETAPYTLAAKQAEDFVLQEKSKIESAGLVISQVHGPWRWPARDFTKEDRAERMEKMKRSIKFTALLGTENFVIHPIMPFGIEERLDSETAQKTWVMNVAFMSELLETAKESGVTICFENMPMPNFSLGTPTDVLRFVKEINDDNFKICFDTGHAVMCKEKTVGDYVRECGAEICAFHIHDNNGFWDLHMLPYFGIIDWEDFGKALKDIDFKGVFSFESSAYPNLSNKDYESLCKMKYNMAKQIING